MLDTVQFGKLMVLCKFSVVWIWVPTLLVGSSRQLKVARFTRKIELKRKGESFQEILTETSPELVFSRVFL